MQCPSCPSLLGRLTVGAIELDECSRCLGMWFDRGELQALIGARLSAKELPQRFVPAQEEPALSDRAACPRCFVFLTGKNEPHGTVGSCHRCDGLWVPAPVLSRILERSPEPSAPPAAHPLPQPAPVRAAPSGPCGSCGGVLVPVVHGAQRFHGCSTCGSAFFPRGGLHQFLSDPEAAAAPWPLPSEDEREPGEHASCPGCGYALTRILWQDRPVRVWACMTCWSMLVSASGLKRLVGAPAAKSDEGLEGPALLLWRMLDAFTEWIVSPPKSHTHSVHRRR